MELWDPAATKDPLPDAGPYVAGPYRIVLHTTEGSTYAGARAAYVSAKVSPHFTVSYERGRLEMWQHVALNRAATALKHPAGTVHTNRLSCVQIEVVGFATKPNWPDGLIVGVADLLAWIMQETDVKPVAPAFPPYPQSYGLNNGVRFSDADWLTFNGICGHCHVPHNDHGDPGNISILQLLGSPARQVTPAASTQPVSKEVTGVRISHGMIGPVNLDNTGKGWVSIQAPLERVLFVEERGSAPARDKGYWVNVNHDVNDSGPETIVTLYGAPGEEVVVYYKVLEEA